MVDSYIKELQQDIKRLEANLAAPAPIVKLELDVLYAALSKMVERFGPCEADYIFSKRKAIQEARKVLDFIDGAKSQ